MRNALHICLVSLLLAACATGGDDEIIAFTPSVTEESRPVEQVYNSALNLLMEQEYFIALAEFATVESQYPYSIWARRALLRQAYIFYLLEAYEEAQGAAERFIQLYPADEAAAYAHYLFAICLYQQTGDVSRSPEKATAALESLRAVVGLFPDSDYARDAKVKITYVRASLAAREMRAGRYYMWRNFYPGALRRFQNVVRDYGDTIYAPEALHRLVEVYLTLGLEDEARHAGAVMSHNFAASSWYKRSYALLQEHVPDASQPSP